MNGHNNGEKCAQLQHLEIYGNSVVDAGWVTEHGRGILYTTDWYRAHHTAATANDDDDDDTDIDTPATTNRNQRNALGCAKQENNNFQLFDYSTRLQTHSFILLIV